MQRLNSQLYKFICVAGRRVLKSFSRELDIYKNMDLRWNDWYIKSICNTLNVWFKTYSMTYKYNCIRDDTFCIPQFFEMQYIHA